MKEPIEFLTQGDSFDPIVERIHETRHRIAAYFGNDFMRMAKFGAGEEDLPADFFTKAKEEKKPNGKRSASLETA